MPTIVDIDGTLVTSGVNPRKKVIEYVNRLKADGPVYVVTGRDSSQRARTEELLKAIGVHYTKLYMSPAGVDNNEYKYNVAVRLGNISIAIDNSPEARAKYEKAGVKKVISPDSI